MNGSRESGLLSGLVTDVEASRYDVPRNVVL